MKKIISYIGSKEKLLNFLEENIFSKYDKEDNYNFFDLFSGTNVVSNYIKENKEWNIYANDFSNYSHTIFSLLLFDTLTKEEKKEILYKLSFLDTLEIDYNGPVFNELSAEGKPSTIEDYEKTFHNQTYNSRMFFSKKVGSKIDTIKKQIKKWKEENMFSSNKICDILMTFVINYADKNSNTTSVYGAYLKTTKKLEKETPFLDKKLILLLKERKNDEKKREIKHFNNGIIEVLLKLNKMDFTEKNKNIIYLDPPYSTRTYESNYHILNYIVDLNFSKEDIKLNSKTAQSKEKPSNDFASKKTTSRIFEKMIEESLKLADNVYISYNTDGLIKQKDIETINNELKIKFPQLKLNTIKKEYKRFKSANKETKQIKEKINKLKSSSSNTKEIEILEEELKNLQINKEEKKLEEIIWHFSNNPKK